MIIFIYRGGRGALKKMAKVVSKAQSSTTNAESALAAAAKAEVEEEAKAAVVLATTALLALFFVLGLSEGISRSLIIAFAALSCITIFVTRRLMITAIRRMRRKGLDAHNIVVIGSPAEARPFIERLEEHEDWGFRVMGVVLPDNEKESSPIPSTVKVPCLGHLKDINQILEKHPVHQVFLTGRAWDKENLYQIADSCEELGVEFSMDANFLGLRVAKAELNDIEGWSVLSFTSTPSLSHSSRSSFLTVPSSTPSPATK